MGEPQICFTCGVADSTEIWHAGLSVSLRAESMPVFNTKNLLLCMSVGGLDMCCGLAEVWGGGMVPRPRSSVLGLAG